MRRATIVAVMAIALTVAISAISFVDEAGWRDGGGSAMAIREVVGLPSIAIGTNYEGTRNPLLEMYVRPLYDIPGGYDYAVPSSFIGTPLGIPEYRETIPEFNITIRKG